MELGIISQAKAPTSGGSMPASSDFPAVRKSDTSPEPVKVPPIQKVDIEAVDQRRLRAIRDALQNSYAVSDRSFTIFKDSSGQYITRFKDLRDGSVTYVPEPEIMKHISGGSSMINLNA